MALEQEIEPQDVTTTDADEIIEDEGITPQEPAKDEPPADKPKETPAQKVARLKRELSRAEKQAGVTDEQPIEKKPTTSELTDDQLDYLDLKGITEQEDLDVIHAVMSKTGQPLRQVLTDDYVASKLKANKDARAVSEATPSSTKRGGGSSVNIEALIAKAERTGELPTDFDLRTKVVNALSERSSSTRPRWHQG